jgi:hypothetical protein
MDREQAKQILSLCRPDNHEDRADPFIADAFALLDTDSELRAWFESEQAQDAHIAAAVESICPPPALKDSILEQMQVRATRSQEEDKLIDFDPSTPPRQPRVRLPIWVSIAACLAVLFGALTIQQSVDQKHSNTPPLVRTAGAPDIVQFLAGQLSRLSGPQDLDIQNQQIDPLREHLSRLGAPTPNALPRKLSDLPTLGCVALSYEGCKLSLICFKNDRVYHLVTAKKGSIQCFSSAEPQCFEIEGQAFKIWDDGEQIYIMAVRGCEADLPKIH